MDNFNSSEYSWCDVTVVMLGRPVGGLRAVEYKIKHKKEVLFAAGKKARSVQKGKKEYEGSITLLQSEVIALNRAAMERGYDDATDIDFDIIVSYLPNNGVITTDKIVGVSISEIPTGMKEGDMQMECALPFLALDIVPNIL